MTETMVFRPVPVMKPRKEPRMRPFGAREQDVPCCARLSRMQPTPSTPPPSASPPTPPEQQQGTSTVQKALKNMKPESSV